MPRHEICTEETWFCLRRVHGNIESERRALEDDMRFLHEICGSHMVCRRKVYVTPKSYLDLISGLAGVGKVWVDGNGTLSLEWFEQQHSMILIVHSPWELGYNRSYHPSECSGWISRLWMPWEICPTKTAKISCTVAHTCSGLYLEMIQEKKDEKDVSLKRLQTGVDKIDEARWARHAMCRTWKWITCQSYRFSPKTISLIDEKQLGKGAFAPWNKSVAWDSMLCSLLLGASWNPAERPTLS